MISIPQLFLKDKDSRTLSDLDPLGQKTYEEATLVQRLTERLCVHADSQPHLPHRDLAPSAQASEHSDQKP